MNKWTKRIGYVVLGMIVGLLVAEGGLFLISRTDWFREGVESAVERALGRDVELGRMGANLRGVFVEDVKIAEQGGLEQGVFARIGRLQIRFSLLHLLRGHLKIRGVVLSDTHIRLVVGADGATNWQDWLNSSQAEEEKESSLQSTPWPFTVRKLRIENLQLSYIDQQSLRTLEAQGLNLEIKNFSFEHEFSLSLWGNFHHQEPQFDHVIPVVLHSKVNLNQLDFAGAYVYIETLKAIQQKSSLTVKGKVFNFLSPQLDLQLSARNFSSRLFKKVTLPSLDVKEITGRVQGAFNTQKQEFILTNAFLKAPGFTVNAKGKLDYSGEVRYEFAGEATGIFGEMGRWFAVLAEPYRLVGTTKLTYMLTQDKMIAQFDLQDMGAFLPQAGQLSNLTGHLTGWEMMDFKTGKLDAKFDGKFEGNPFTLSLIAKQTPQKITADLKASAKELAWRIPADNSSANNSQQTPTNLARQTQRSLQSSWPLPPIDLKADLNVEKLEVSYLYGTEIAFDADVTGLTPDLKQTHGNLHLRTKDGKILDLYKLTNANPLTKVLFMSLNVTGKVFNSLNVLGILKGLSGGLVSAVTKNDKVEEQPAQAKTQTVLGPDGEPLEITIEESDQKIEGEMPYDKFDTQVDFVQGKATVKEGTFVSPMMSLRLDGTTDFNTGEVDLTVRAAPGRHEVDGMMPLTLKIGGTVDDPKGNMQLLSSVTSLVTQTVTNNVVSRNITKGVKGIFGLFKKKEKSENPQ